MNSKQAIRSDRGGWLFVCRFLAAVGTALALVVGTGGCVRSDDHAAQTEAGAISLQRTSKASFLTFEAVLDDAATDQKVRFVIDTGAEASGILGANASGLTPTGAVVSVIGLYGGRLDGKVVRSELRSTAGGHLFGDQRSVGAEMVVFPPGARLPGNVQALLGIDFLNHHASYLDVAAAELFAKPMRSPRRAGVGVDLVRSSAGGGELWFAACEHRGKRLVWLLDTGAAQTLLSQSSAERIAALSIGQVGHLVDSGGHRVALRHSVLRNTRWGRGDHTLGALPIGITELPHLQNFRLADGSPIDGVLGIDMLTRRAAIIDFQNGQMLLSL